MLIKDFRLHAMISDFSKDSMMPFKIQACCEPLSETKAEEQCQTRIIALYYMCKLYHSMSMISYKF